MDSTEPTPKPFELNPLVEIIDFDKLAKNAIVVIRVNEATPEVREAFGRQIQYINTQLKDVMKDKKIVLMLTDKDFTFEAIDEQAMNQIGWYKKEEKRIIT